MPGRRTAASGTPSPPAIAKDLVAERSLAGVAWGDWRRPGQQPPGIGLSHQALQAFGLGGCDPSTERRQPIVPASLVVGLRRRALFTLGDEPCTQQALDRAV